MIGDVDRGSAWTRALLGVLAPEIHVCGDPAALPIVTALSELCGDSLEVRNYERLTPLKPLETTLGADYSKIEAGGCSCSSSLPWMITSLCSIPQYAPEHCVRAAYCRRLQVTAWWPSAAKTFTRFGA